MNEMRGAIARHIQRLAWRMVRMADGIEFPGYKRQTVRRIRAARRRWERGVYLFPWEIEDTIMGRFA